MLSYTDRRTAFRVRSGKYCGECGDRKWGTFGGFCQTCFNRLPEDLRSSLLRDETFAEAFHTARRWLETHHH